MRREDLKKNIRDHISGLLSEEAEQWMRGKGADRPEVEWLQRKFCRVQEKYGLKSRTETDRFIYEQMYKECPQTRTEYLKIRYWRTGRCTPTNREICIQFGEAMELSKEERSFLIQRYYDSSETLYTRKICEETVKKEYLRKCIYMRELIGRYLERVPEEKMRRYKIDPEERHHYFRHLYFTDAFRYVSLRQAVNPEVLKKHITSTRYDSELRRQMKLLGEIPRRSMIRHLLILNAPELSVEKISSQLAFFGYLPLDENHTLPTGEYLDRTVISLLKLYEEQYDPAEPETGLAWIQEACRVLDEFFAEKKYPHMRFMYFKALEM